MFATDQKGWDTFDLTNDISNLSSASKQIITELIRSAMTKYTIIKRN